MSHPLRSIGAIFGLAAGRIALDLLQAAGSALGAAHDLAKAKDAPPAPPRGPEDVPAKADVERALDSMIKASVPRRPPGAPRAKRREKPRGG